MVLDISPFPRLNVGKIVSVAFHFKLKACGGFLDSLFYVVVQLSMQNDF